MQIIFKIGEFKPKTKADLTNVFNYITRESAVYKARGIGVSSNPKIAVRQFMINKRKYKKAEDNKNRFAYHEILSFEAGTDPELAYKIAEDYCKNLHYKKGFNCYFAIQINTNNVHAHILVDSVNFKTGNMLLSENEKELEKRPELKNKIEFYSLEQQMKFAEDMAIKNGYEIEDEKRYAFMHEAKKNDKNARKWLTKNQYQAFKREQEKDEDKSWRNLIKEKIEEMYKRSDITEQNISEIAKEYGLEVTRHNTEKQTITFALLDTEGKRTKQRLKLVEQINKKKKKGEEVAEEDIKLAVKLERLEEQERGNFASEDINIFTYSNFFGGKKKEEIEKREETREEILEFFAKEKEKLRIRLEAEAKAKEVKEDIKTPVNTYIVEDSKHSDFELEKEYKTEKDILDNFYKAQEDNKKEQDSKAKKLEQEIKDIEKAEIDKITKSDEVLRRLNIEEQERQAESKAKAKQEEEKKKDNRPVIFDRLKDFKEITSELETLEFNGDHRLTYSSTDIEKDFNNAVYLAFHNLISRKVEFNNKKEANRANDIMENVKNNNDSENIRKNLDLLDELIKDNEKEYERLKKNNWREEEETDLETTEIVRTDEEKEIIVEVAEIVESKSSLTNGKEEITDSEYIITESKPKITSDSTVTNSKQEEQEEKHDLESKQVDLDSIMDKIDYYELVEKYNLYNTLPPFQVIGEDIIYNSETGEGDTYLAKSLIIDVKSEEYWDNMNVKDIKQWENTGLFTIYYTDNNDNFKEFAGYEDYSKDTIKQFLKENTEVAEELAREYMQEQDSDSKTKDSKDYEVEKKKDREIDFN